MDLRALAAEGIGSRGEDNVLKPMKKQDNVLGDILGIASSVGGLFSGGGATAALGLARQVGDQTQAQGPQELSNEKLFNMSEDEIQQITPSIPDPNKKAKRLAALQGSSADIIDRMLMG